MSNPIIPPRMPASLKLPLNNEQSNIPPAPPVEPVGYNPPSPIPSSYTPTPPLSVGYNSGDGVGSADTKALNMFVRGNGYVFGYVVKNAPAVQIYLTQNKTKGGGIVYNLKARESKPAKATAVFVSIPEVAITHGSSLAEPMDIIKGNVNFNGEVNDHSMIDLMLPFSAAVLYIQAYGNLLPEYAPNIGEYTKHWNREDILRGRNGVSFVEVRSSRSTRKNTTSYTYNLRTTRKGESVYTPNNILPLSAYVTIPVKIKSDTDAYNVNESAFGALRYRSVGSGVKAQSDTNKLIFCCNQMGDALWEKTYKIVENGEEKEVNGIGSCFFMNGSEDTNASGKTIPKCQCSYIPWHKPAKSVETSDVTHIVKRVLIKDTNGEPKRMQAERVQFDMDLDAFKPYARFARKVIGTYAQLDDIKALTGSKKTTAPVTISESQLEKMTDYMDKNRGDIDDLIDYYARERSIKKFSQG